MLMCLAPLTIQVAGVPNTVPVPICLPPVLHQHTVVQSAPRTHHHLQTCTVGYSNEGVWWVGGSLQCPALGWGPQANAHWFSMVLGLTPRPGSPHPHSPPHVPVGHAIRVTVVHVQQQGRRKMHVHSDHQAQEDQVRTTADAHTGRPWCSPRIPRPSRGHLCWTQVPTPRMHARR